MHVLISLIFQSPTFYQQSAAMRLCGSHIIQLLYPYLAFSVSFEPYNRDGVCLQRRLKYIFKYNLGP